MLFDEAVVSPLVVRIGLFVFSMVHSAFAPAAVSWVLGGDALALEVVLAALVAEYQSAFPLSVQLLVFELIVADFEPLILLLWESLARLMVLQGV